MSLNRVALLGNVGRDPELKSFANGGRIANFTIATSERWKDKQTGEQKERTDWHSISVQSDGLVGIVDKYVRKGSKLYLEGQLQTRKWQDQAGNDRYTTEVVLRPYSGKLELLDKREGGSSGGGNYGGDGTYGNYGWSGGGAGSTSSGAPSGGAPAGAFDDEIPFLPERR